MTNRRYIDLGDLAREIRSSIDENGLENGLMHYKTESSRIDNETSIIFAYAFLGKESTEIISFDKDDPDFKEYINNPGEKGRALLAYRLGQGLELISSDIKEGISKITVYKPVSPGHDTSETIPQEILECNRIKMGNEAIKDIKRLFQ